MELDTNPFGIPDEIFWNLEILMISNHETGEIWENFDDDLWDTESEFFHEIKIFDENDKEIIGILVNSKMVEHLISQEKLGNNENMDALYGHVNMLTETILTDVTWNPNGENFRKSNFGMKISTLLDRSEFFQIQEIEISKYFPNISNDFLEEISSEGQTLH